MQKWEYLEVLQTGAEHGVMGLGGYITHPRVVNGRELPNWKNGPDIHTFLNQLGEQGWELVSVEGARYTFKRPKP